MLNQPQMRELTEGKQFLAISVDALAKIADFSWSSFEAQVSKEKHKGILGSIFGMWQWLLKQNAYPTLFQSSLIDWMLDRLTRSLTPTPERRRHELFSAGILLQQVLALLLRANDTQVNEALEVTGFGEVFGKQLQLQYEDLKLCQLHKDPPYDDYPEQNNLRLNAFKSLINSDSMELRRQFLKSGFVERLVAEYVKDKRRFTSRFEKIDLKFLAFKQWYPLRAEAIGFLEEALKGKKKAPEIYAEVMQRIDMHLLVQHECRILEVHDEEFLLQSALLLLTIIMRETAGEKKDERVSNLSLIHICRCRRYAVCRSRWSPYH
eukprot:TRINITY_DN6408_c0_g3_i2.p1 TRINITY_DN6408_c0_g3~~TRINITY_DN6408_c0_g3_i2.p1  ORF type:complete len:321 (-),score=78.41 TRINITY_DN6408_c0_g3_i2:17-979(-)